jgi:hypothetical protein
MNNRNFVRSVLAQGGMGKSFRLVLDTSRNKAYGVFRLA